VRDLAERLAVEIEVLHHGAREGQETLGEFAENGQAAVGFEDLDDRSESHGAEKVTRGVGGAVAGLDDFGAGHAFRERQPGLDAQRPPQQDDEEHADQPAGQQDEGSLPVVRFKVAPKARAADVNQNEGGDGEDGAGHQRFAHRGRGAGDVLLEHAAFEPGQTEERERDHGGGNGGCHGLAGLHSQVGVGRSEDEREEEAEAYGFHRHFGLVVVGAHTSRG